MYDRWMSHMEVFAFVGPQGFGIKIVKCWGDLQTMAPVEDSITILGDDGRWYPLPIERLG
jgi:hypothetical protein